VSHKQNTVKVILRTYYKYQKKMHLVKIYLFIILLSNSILYGQLCTIHGYIKDAQTGEALISAYCYNALSLKGTTTNSYGYYSLTVPKGMVKLSVSYVGYQNTTLELFIDKDSMINFSLYPITKEIQEVVVNQNIPLHQQVLMGKTTVPIQTVNSIPSFVGISDLMKAITFLPGISSGREGYSDIYVRGGDRGQNLILLDGMKLYNTNHVGGFVSLFNSHIIKNIDVYKGGFPARYGGRASSIIDISTREGNQNELHGKVNIGILNSGGLIEGPLTDKVNFILAARTTYYDLLNMQARRSYKNTGMGSYFSYTFYDINSKISWQPSDRNKLFLSIFAASDISGSADAAYGSFQESITESKLKIQNIGVTLGQQYILSSGMFIKNSLAYSVYSNKLKTYDKHLYHGSNEINNYTSLSEISDLTFQSRWEYYPSSYHSIKTGIEVCIYDFNPGLNRSYTFNENANITTDTIVGYQTSIHAYENNIYIEDDIQLLTKLRLNVGIRGTLYHVSDTNYLHVEPRISLRWLLTDNFSFKSNYTIMNQYNHVLVNKYMVFEREIWLTSTKDIPPQKAEQVSVGWFYTNDKLKMDFSIESFYKKMYNLLEYQPPIDREDNKNNIDNIIAKNGKGKAYGIETQINKSQGRLSGSISYTLSWNYRQFANLNSGKWFPFFYDRRHDLNIRSSYLIDKKYMLNANFVLTSGTSYTMPVGYVKKDNFLYDYFVYDGINNQKLPIYHRLDLALVKKWSSRKGRNKQFEINIFNVYARKNPLYLYYNPNNGKIYQKTIFTIIPTISYSIEF